MYRIFYYDLARKIAGIVFSGLYFLRLFIRTPRNCIFNLDNFLHREDQNTSSIFPMQQLNVFTISNKINTFIFFNIQ